MKHAPFSKFKLVDRINRRQRALLRNRLFSGFRIVNGDDTLRRYTVVDIFCGCGGLTYGLESTGRFKTLLGIDASEDALRTFAHNHGDEVKTLQADLATLEPSRVRAELRKRGILKGDLDCLVGGPPCEGFSQNHGKAIAGRRTHDFLAGKARATKRWYRARNVVISKVKRPRRSELHDDRNHLFRSLLAIAELTRPKVVLIENVREFLTYRDGEIRDEINDFFASIGYSVQFAILNAADYGVPQLRKRAFIVALRGDVAAAFPESALPAATHVPNNGKSRRRAGWYVSVKEVARPDIITPGNGPSG